MPATVARPTIGVSGVLEGESESRSAAGAKPLTGAGPNGSARPPEFSSSPRGAGGETGGGVGSVGGGPYTSAAGARLGSWKAGASSTDAEITASSGSAVESGDEPHNEPEDEPDDEGAPGWAPAKGSGVGTVNGEGASAAGSDETGEEETGAEETGAGETGAEETGAGAGGGAAGPGSEKAAIRAATSGSSSSPEPPADSNGLAPGHRAPSTGVGGGS
ncbi:hypothetical protein [Dactylosporangium salmoneum]|uniref:hypothetical protein n=1 Tax=Dactylosporangium salmoneum TaxID=53361 RepID=UPI0031D4736F